MACCSADDEEQTERPPPAHDKPRSCTDIFWLCLFILFLFLMILIAAFAVVYGNPLRLLNGYDSFGNTCGTSYNEKIGNLTLSGMDMSDKTHLFFMDVRHVRKSLKICVKKCPDRNLENMEDLRKFYVTTESSLCSYGFDMKEHTLSVSGKVKALSSHLGPCPVFPVYNSVSVLNRCIPRPVKELADQIIGNIYSVLNSWDTVEKVLGDLYATWKEITILMIAAFLLSLVMIAILHWLASFVAWIFMLVVCIAAIAGTGILWWTYVDIKRGLDKTPHNQLLEESINNETAFLAYSIIATIITVIILLLVIAIRKSVSFMAQLFEESAECLAALPALFAQPLITFIALLVFFTIWLYIIVCLATSSKPVLESYYPFTDVSPLPTLSPQSEKMSALSLEGTGITLKPVSNISLSDLKTFTWMKFGESTWVRYMWWIYLIGLIWVSEFILSCQQMVISGAVAHWYFDNRKAGSGSVISSTTKLVCYHLGSVAKGSFLVTLFKLPRLILTYLDMKLKKASEGGSKCAHCCLRSCICCLYCFEKFIKFMNHNAYTVIAMEGHSFCTSAKIAWDALVTNALDLATINSVGDFILFLGKCIVTAVTGSVGLLIMKNNQHLHFYAVPTIAICIFSFFIAHCVLSLYEIVIDTMFLCKCEGKRLYGPNWEAERAAKHNRDTGELSLMNQPASSD